MKDPSTEQTTGEEDTLVKLVGFKRTGVLLWMGTGLFLACLACEGESHDASSSESPMPSDAQETSGGGGEGGDSTPDGAMEETVPSAGDALDAEAPLESDAPVELVATEPPPGSLQVTVIRGKLTSPWALDFLPDGRVLLTERVGDLHILNLEDGSLSEPLTGVPEVWAEGQGGLLDVLVDPEFETNQTLYLSFAQPGNFGAAGTAVARATLGPDGLENVTVLFEQVPKVVGPNHFGSRLQFDATGALMVGLGERFEFMDEAQKLTNHLGKIIRILPDGGIPADNPFVENGEAKPEIWSYGHRNIQGMAVHPVTGVVYIHEHGPFGGDELNRPEPGANYGWPLASYGDHYWGDGIPDDHAGQGFVEPLHTWTASIAPSGMTFYSGDEFPHWRGNLFVGALAYRHLARLVLEDDKVVEEEQLLLERDERIRAVEQGPDGALYVLTDDKTEGNLLRLTWE